MAMAGMPAEVVGWMRDEPWWVGLKAMAPSSAYDSEAMGYICRGGTVPTHLVGGVTIPALVLCGGANPACMIDVGRQVAETMPNGSMFWRTRNTSWPQRYSHLCWPSSSPTETTSRTAAAST